MASSVAVLFDLIDGLVADLRANTTWTIDDGPTVDGNTPGTYIVIGADNEGVGGEALQTWHSLGLQAERSEQGALQCLVVSRSGGTDIPAQRALAKAALADLTYYAQASTVARSIEMHLDTAQLRQAQTPDGCEVVIDTRLSYTALLTDWP